MKLLCQSDLVTLVTWVSISLYGLPILAITDHRDFSTQTQLFLKYSKTQVFSFTFYRWRSATALAIRYGAFHSTLQWLHPAIKLYSHFKCKYKKKNTILIILKHTEKSTYIFIDIQDYTLREKNSYFRKPPNWVFVLTTLSRLSSLK